MTQTEPRPKPARHSELEHDVETLEEHWSASARAQPLHLVLGLILTIPRFLLHLLTRPRKRATWDGVRRYAKLRLVPYPLEKLRSKFDFVPHAIIAKPISSLSNVALNKVTLSSDNLDHYEGFGFILAGKIPVVLMHYNGHPENTSTIYLPRGITNVDHITSLIQLIISSFGLPPDVVEWQRKDDPDL